MTKATKKSNQATTRSLRDNVRKKPNFYSEDNVSKRKVIKFSVILIPKEFYLNFQSPSSESPSKPQQSKQSKVLQGINTTCHLTTNAQEKESITC